MPDGRTDRIRGFRVMGHTWLRERTSPVGIVQANKVFHDQSGAPSEETFSPK